MMKRLLEYAFLSGLLLNCGILSGASVGEFKEYYGVDHFKGGLEVQLELTHRFPNAGSVKRVGENGEVQGGIPASTLVEAVVLSSNEKGDFVKIGDRLSLLSRENLFDVPFTGRMQGVISNCIWNLQGSSLKTGNYDLAFRPYEDDDPKQKEVTKHFLVYTYKGFVSTMGLPIQEGSVVWSGDKFTAMPSIEVGLSGGAEHDSLEGSLLWKPENNERELSLNAGGGHYRVSWEQDVEFDEIARVPKEYALELRMDGQEDPLRHLKVKIEGVTRIPDTEDWVDPMANLRGVLENLTVVSMQSETNGVVLFERGEHRRIDPELNPFRAKKRGTFYLFYVIVGFTALLYLVSYLRRKGGV